MKDIGYYCDFLDDYEKRVISDGELYQFTELLLDLALDLHHEVNPVEGEELPPLLARYEDLTSPQQIQLVKALCDRIELKLMEQAGGI